MGKKADQIEDLRGALDDERDALAAALADIAGGECWQTHCPDGDLCDVCTARKALGTLP